MILTCELCGAAGRRSCKTQLSAAASGAAAAAVSHVYIINHVFRVGGELHGLFTMDTNACAHVL